MFVFAVRLYIMLPPDKHGERNDYGDETKRKKDGAVRCDGRYAGGEEKSS